MEDLGALRTLRRRRSSGDRIGGRAPGVRRPSRGSVERCRLARRNGEGSAAGPQPAASSARLASLAAASSASSASLAAAASSAGPAGAPRCCTNRTRTRSGHPGPLAAGGDADAFSTRRPQHLSWGSDVSVGQGDRDQPEATRQSGCERTRGIDACAYYDRRQRDRRGLDPNPPARGSSDPRTRGTRPQRVGVRPGDLVSRLRLAGDRTGVRPRIYEQPRHHRSTCRRLASRPWRRAQRPGR
jgi:hypothetical protein